MNPSQTALYLTNVFFMAIWLGPTTLSVVALALVSPKNIVRQYILGVSVANFAAAMLAASLRAMGFAIPLELRSMLSLVGCAMLFFFGVRQLNRSRRHWHKPSATVEDYAMHNLKRDTSAFALGIATHLSNPYTTLFYTSTFLSIVPLDSNYLESILFLTAYAVLIDAVVLTSYSSGASLVERSAKNNDKTRVFQKIVPVLAGLTLCILAMISFFDHISKLSQASLILSIESMIDQFVRIGHGKDVNGTSVYGLKDILDNLKNIVFVLSLLVFACAAIFKQPKELDARVAAHVSYCGVAASVPLIALAFALLRQTIHIVSHLPFFVQDGITSWNELIILIVVGLLYIMLVIGLLGISIAWLLTYASTKLNASETETGNTKAPSAVIAMPIEPRTAIDEYVD